MLLNECLRGYQRRPHRRDLRRLRPQLPQQGSTTNTRRTAGRCPMISRRNSRMCGRRPTPTASSGSRWRGSRPTIWISHLRATRHRGWREGDHPVVRQGHDAAGLGRPMLMRDPMTDGPSAKPRCARSLGSARQGNRSAGAVRRQHQRRAWRPRHRGQDRGRVDQCLWRPRDAARPCWEIKQPKRREALIENEAKARLSKELVKLDDKVPLPCRYRHSGLSHTTQKSFLISG